MPSFRFGHATGADWRRTAAKCLEQIGSGFGSLGFVYATDVIADDFGSILEMLKRGTGVAHWVGTVGTGVLATGREYMDQPAMTVMVGDFDPATFRILSSMRSAADIASASVRCESGEGNFAVVHADPRNAEVSALITGLAAKVESGFLVGGLTSSR